MEGARHVYALGSLGVNIMGIWNIPATWDRLSYGKIVRGYFVELSGGEMRGNRGKPAQISDIGAIAANKVVVNYFGFCLGGVASIQ